VKFFSGLRISFCSEKKTASASAEKSSTDVWGNFLVKTSLQQAEKISTNFPESGRAEEFKLQGRG
jgi:hypothetical protein